MDPDQVQHFVGPDLGPNCLQSYLLMVLTEKVNSAFWIILHALLSAEFFQINVVVFKKTLAGISSKGQTD